MTVGIILQARMNSTRLPGKVMKPLDGKPLIAHAVERLNRSAASDVLILATGDGSENDPLAEFAQGLGVAVYRGVEDDVLDRYVACAKAFGLDEIVRATGDNPFVDTEECDRLIAFRAEHSLAYASAFPAFGSGLPIGVGVEIMTLSALEASHRSGREPHHREHVNEYIQEHPELFPQDTLIAAPSKYAPDLSLTVDTYEDFVRADALASRWRREGSVGSPADTPWLIAAAKAL